ncbi:MAG: bile acid:sodium symporter family protein [Nitrososphaeraceae archaeon]
MTKFNNNNNKRKNSLLLLAVVLASMMCGLFFSDQSKILEPYLLIWLGMLLFLNLIRLDIMDLVSDFVRPKRIIILSILKLVIIPLTMYQIIHVIYSKESLSVLLLSGISTGLGAPFIVNFVGGKLQTVVAMIMVTSLAVPLVLPVLVYSLFKTQFSIPFLNMVILLSTALFIPLASGWATKRYAPKIAKVIEERSLPASLIVIVLINLGMFAKFSNYFFEDPLFVLAITGLAFALFGIYGLFGYAVDAIFLSNNVGTKNEKKNERLSAFISMSYVNNILVAVFAQQFFGSQVAALAAFYNIPYYIGILILARSVSNDLRQAVK